MSVDHKDYDTWYEYELDVIAEKRMNQQEATRTYLWFIVQLLVEMLRRSEVSNEP